MKYLFKLTLALTSSILSLYANAGDGTSEAENTFLAEISCKLETHYYDQTSTSYGLGTRSSYTGYVCTLPDDAYILDLEHDLIYSANEALKTISTNPDTTEADETSDCSLAYANEGIYKKYCINLDTPMLILARGGAGGKSSSGHAQGAGGTVELATSIADYEASYGTQKLYWLIGDVGTHDGSHAAGGASSLVLTSAQTPDRDTTLMIAGGGGGAGKYGDATAGADYFVSSYVNDRPADLDLYDQDILDDVTNYGGQGGTAYMWDAEPTTWVNDGNNVDGAGDSFAELIGTNGAGENDGDDGKHGSGGGGGFFYHYGEQSSSSHGGTGGGSYSKPSPTEHMLDEGLTLYQLEAYINSDKSDSGSWFWTNKYDHGSVTLIFLVDYTT